MFPDRAAPISDCLRRFLLRAKTVMLYIPQRNREVNILGREIFICGKIGFPV
jgi:hypothetical protein